MAQSQSGWDRRRATIATRIEIVALRLCLEHGVDGVTVDEIARVAGLSRRTFYRYFEGIEDICLASPRRSLERISHDVSSRPAHESVREAIVNAFQQKNISDEELQIQSLGHEISKRDPAAWLRIMGRLETTTIDVFANAIAERLQISGKAERSAALLAKVLRTVITHVTLGDELFSEARILDAALSDLVAMLGD